MAVKWLDPDGIFHLNNNAAALLHFATGVYIWELMNDLPFDLTLMRMRSKCAGSIYARSIYLACRYLTLISMLFYAAQYNVATISELGCKVFTVVSQAMSLSAITTASTLIAIRVIAIWNSSVIILGLCIIVLTAEFGLSVYELSQVQFVTSTPGLGPTCATLVLQQNRTCTTAVFAVNVLLLVLMLAGLLKLRDARRSHGIWKFLWWQGLIWLALAIFIEVPRMTFVWLNLNQPTNMMVSTLEIVALSIGATRMYCALWTYDQAAYNISTLTTFKAAPPVPTRERSDG